MRTTYKIKVIALRGLIALAPLATLPASQPLAPATNPSKKLNKPFPFRIRFLKKCDFSYVPLSE
ncbi:hypothetical protein [Ellagibacter isourolithinifaciens]|uniref:hypothetical protein n=1 Tax=Ellagibacter isourolithinifaciens TaxID=2137581 RepID=UPI003A8E78D7